MPTAVLCRKKVLGNTPAQFIEGKKDQCCYTSGLVSATAHDFATRKAPTVQLHSN
jgi:hypothetical protein